MIDKKSKVEQYHSIQPIKYPILAHMRTDQKVSYENRSSQLFLIIILRSIDDTTPSRLVLSFSKVRELHISSDASALQLSFLNIVPVHDQWEDVNYKVFESE